jgi:hypothetical protein
MKDSGRMTLAVIESPSGSIAEETGTGKDSDLPVLRLKEGSGSLRIGGLFGSGAITLIVIGSALETGGTCQKSEISATR